MFPNTPTGVSLNNILLKNNSFINLVSFKNVRLRKTMEWEAQESDDLDAFISEYMKHKTFEKSAKLFDYKNPRVLPRKNIQRTFERFEKYLNAIEKVKSESYDLGFDINFGSVSTAVKYPVKRDIKLSKRSNEKRKRNRKSEVPKEFLMKIEKLGFKKENARVLYETKLDWTAMNSDSKIYCTQHGCDHNTFISEDCLRDHCINAHQWGEYPCDAVGCYYIGYSRKNLAYHKGMHGRSFDKTDLYPCNFPGCTASFSREGLLKIHQSIHTNDLEGCEFCPYRFAEPKQYETHLKHHFKLKELSCDQCGLQFTTVGELNKHYQLHEGLIYACKLCDSKYTASFRETMRHHFMKKHSSSVDNLNWSSIQNHIVQK